LRIGGPTRLGPDLTAMTGQARSIKMDGEKQRDDSQHRRDLNKADHHLVKGLNGGLIIDSIYINLATEHYNMSPERKGQRRLPTH